MRFAWNNTLITHHIIVIHHGATSQIGRVIVTTGMPAIAFDSWKNICREANLLRRQYWIVGAGIEKTNWKNNCQKKNYFFHADNFNKVKNVFKLMRNDQKDMNHIYDVAFVRKRVNRHASVTFHI